jgi:hypothetical protein
MAKQCKKCGNTKEYTHFSKRSNSKDGYQFHCKECNVKENELFRNQLNPQYMKGWVSNNKIGWNEYIREYVSSDNINKIYSITNPIGEIYIGFTRRKKIGKRFSEHKYTYNCNKHRNKIPLLWNSFDKWGIKNHTFELLKEFKGNKENGLKMECKLIQFYKSVNKSLNIKD